MQVWQRGGVKGVCLTLLCLFSVLYPLFAGPGPVNTRGGGDSPFLFVRLEQLVAGLRAGSFPVRWMPDAAYGLGYPFFSFYAALPYYVAAAFRLLGWGPILSLQVTQMLGFVLAAAAMALLARRVLRHPAAVALAVAAYTCAPFHMVNVYVRGDSLSEFYGFIFYPLIFWALLAVHDRPSLPNMAWLALSLGGLVVTHNLSALIFVPFVALGALFLLWPRLSPRDREHAQSGHSLRGAGSIMRTLRQQIAWRKVGLMLGGALLGLALSASLWMTIAADLPGVWMGVKDIQTKGYFNYAQHLRGLDLVQSSFLFDYEGVSGRTPFAMGTVQAALVLVSAVVWGAGALRRGKHSEGGPLALPWFWLAGLALSTVMITSSSRFLWDHLPVLPVVQFPWRFLSVQAFFGALLIGALAQRLPRPWWIAAAGVLLVTGAAIGNLRPEYLPVGEADITPERLALFESFTTNIGTTIRGEYLPSIVEPRPVASAVTLNRGQQPGPMVLAGQLDAATLLKRDGRSQRWQVTVESEQAYLAFYTFYFPGWQAYRDDRERIPIEPLPGSGLIALRLPRGEHALLLRFERTFVRWVADGLSGAALLLVAVLAWPCVRALTRAARRRALAAAGGGGLFLVVLVMLGRAVAAAPAAFSADDLSMDFDRMPFLHHNPQGINFGGQARLASYAYDEVVHGGQALSVQLNWAQVDAGLDAEVKLVTLADVHPEGRPPPPPWAVARARIDSPVTSHILAIPDDVPSGPYYLRLRVYDDWGEVPALNERGETLGTTYLRPVYVENPRPAREGDPVLARFGERIVLRDDVQVEVWEGNWVTRLTWQATAPIPANYTCKLELFSTDGRSLNRRDFAEGPGHGFWPTSAWPVGEWLTDRLSIPIPERVKGEDAAALSIVLYDRSQPGFPAVGSAIVPLGEREHRYEEPEIERRIEATFGGQVRLLGYDLETTGSSLRMVLHWRALDRVTSDGVIFVHLFDPASEQIVAQSDARPVRGAYPTHWWRAGEVVSDEITLSVAGAPGGSYRLAVGMYDAGSRDRLAVVTAVGEEIPDGRLILEDEITLPFAE